MTNNELLLAISGMLEPIREDIRELKAEIAGIKEEVAALKKDVNILKQDMVQVKTEIKEIRTELTQLTDKVTCLENYTRNISYKQEMDVIPRLQNIEQCYLSTYERYKLGVDDHEVMKQDISVLKLVVSEHSEKLQRIS